MNRVDMDGTHDCGAACLAMVFGMTKASDAYPAIGRDINGGPLQGMIDAEVLQILNNFGRSYRVFLSREYVIGATGLSSDALDGGRLPTRAELQTKLGMSQTGCAIVAVPSLNSERFSHYVFCERGEMHDPTPTSSDKNRYIGTANALPVEVVIFIGNEDA